MKYRDLIQFEPVETVIQLTSSADISYAAQLVQTYVISDRMADIITNLIIPNLQFNQPYDYKGLLIVGNYGTGKSHLLSVIASIAQEQSLLEQITQPQVKEAMLQIAGKFKVARLEIGAVTNDLRSIVCTNLEHFLAKIGVSYLFPDAAAITNNKDCLQEMMADFHEVYPDHGLLIVIDELLDYLRSRKDHDLIRDLGFLRELGEVCRNSRIRVMAGIQESLFDNPKFQFTADSLRRVKDRFEQIKISREDIAFVVEQRLLKKNDAQRSMIRSHLEKFTDLYDHLATNLNEYINLFPVHPVYLDVFEQIYIAEKREVLKSISVHIKNILDQDVPEDETGLISFDAYWQYIKDDPSFRADPDVRKVIDASSVIEDKIVSGFTKSAYKESSLRILNALSVHRLTTGEINNRIGITPIEIKEDLTLSVPGIPERTADFLAITVNTILTEMRRLTSGKFIGYNKDNQQYYIEVEGGEDPDVLIAQRADDLSDYTLDQYYFALLRRVLQCSDDTYVSGFAIWEHDLAWPEKRATRAGYLFFGAPNERSTAQPPRDFYIYFVQPFDPPHFIDEQKPDEIFYYLKEKPSDFMATLRLFGGAMEMAGIASMADRRLYREKGEIYLGELARYLLEHSLHLFEVAYRGKVRQLAERLQAAGGGAGSFREIVDNSAGHCLGSHFAETYPDYPTFPVLMTRQNIRQNTEEALKYLASGQSRLGARVLDGLQLLDSDKVQPDRSPYARYFLSMLKSREANQVVNREEIIAGPNEAELDIRFKLEPELVVVILAALVHNGDIVLNLPGKEINASNLAEIPRLGAEELVNFKYFKLPVGLNIPALEKLLQLLDLPPGLISNEATREDAIRRIQESARRMIRLLIDEQRQVASALPCWGINLLSKESQESYGRAADEYKAFLESLSRFNSVGKLKQFPHQEADIAHQEDLKNNLKDMEKLVLLVADLAPLGSYLMTASAVLPEDHPLVGEIMAAREQLRSTIPDSKRLMDNAFRQEMVRQASKLKQEYIAEYYHLHGMRRLNKIEDDRKVRYLEDRRIAKLMALKEITYLPDEQLQSLLVNLTSLKACYALKKDELELQATCQHCGFRPVEERDLPAVGLVLTQVDDDIDRVLENLKQILLTNLQDSRLKESYDLLDTAQKKAIDSFNVSKQFPEQISEQFIKAVQLMFSGLDKITLSMRNLQNILKGDGGPCTLDELKRRFESYLVGMLKSKDTDKIRIIIE